MTDEVQAAQAPSLTVTDLIVLFNLTQAAAQRGAIRAEEMQVVGGVFDKLTQFLTAAGAINQAAPADDQSNPTSAQ
jgi:hypothetical protein